MQLAWLHTTKEPSRQRKGKTKGRYKRPADSGATTGTATVEKSSEQVLHCASHTTHTRAHRQPSRQRAFVRTPLPPCHTLKSFVYAAPSPARYLGVCTSRATSARSCFGGTRQLAGSCERKKGGKVERLGRQETAACSTAPSLTLAIRCHVSPWRGSAVR